MPTRPSKLRVLLVDDNDDARELLHDLLITLGYQIESAHNGITALAIAANFRPEVAVLDLGLPEMDGYELARQLRRISGLENIRLVALTGYGTDNDRRRSHEAGIDEHLVKPIGVAMLTRSFESAAGELTRDDQRRL